MKLRDRASIHDKVHSILCNPDDRMYNSGSCKTAINRILKTNDRFLTAKGLALKRSCLELKKYKSLVIPKEKSKANSFLRQVNSIIQSNPKWEDQIEIDILKHSMAKATHSKKGGGASHLNEKARMLWVAMYQKSPHTTRMLAANINGPSERSLRRRAADLDKATQNVGGKSIIDMTDEQATKQMCEYIKNIYATSNKEKGHAVRVSYSIDATAVATGLYIHAPSNTLVGGAYPHHSLDVPPSGNDLRRLIDTFDKEKGSRKKASEVKLATVVLQNSHNDICPTYQFLAQPQSKNFNSRFNYQAVEIMLKAQKELRDEGFNFMFLSTAVDGVSCDSKFVVDVLLRFMKGEISHTAMTDTNHNGKNLRYQALLGGNMVKTIGCVLIDGGMVKAGGVKQEIWRVKDWADDHIVLRLYSAETVFKILNLMNGKQDAATVAVTCLHLYFMRVHLVAVNCKGILKAQERVTMIWHCLLWILHVDGVCITTKRNFLSECVSLCFLIMRDDVKEPHLLTSEPSEHSNALLRCMQREFTVKDLLILLNKLLRTWRAFSKGGLRIARRAHGYASTLAASLGNQSVENDSGANDQLHGPVHVVHSPLYDSPASQIWKELEGLLAKSSDSMKQLLKSVCGVKEEHPMMAQFHKESSLQDLIKRCESIYKNKDSVFKKESTYTPGAPSNDSTDDNDDRSEEIPLPESGPNIEYLTQERNNLFKDILGGDIADNEIDEDTLASTHKEVILEDTIVGDGVTIYKSFIDVVSANHFRTFSEGLDTNPILKSMNLMTLKNRERGSGICKFNTLNGRWFKKEMSATVATIEDVNSIERGRVVTICGSDDYFLVYEVWKQMGNKKVYPSETSDVLVWPLHKDVISSKKYRIGLRRMAFDASTKKITYMSYGDSKDGKVEDGKSVHNTYFMIKDLKAISGVYVKIDI